MHLVKSSFNPRARVGRDQILIKRIDNGRFQSTRPRGARLVMGIEHLVKSSFNPRARVGRDIPPSRGGEVINKVSIHAPAWGATASVKNAATSRMFQSTRPRGARLFYFSC